MGVWWKAPISLGVSLPQNSDLWVGPWRTEWSGTEGATPIKEGVNLRHVLVCHLLRSVRARGSQSCLNGWPPGFANLIPQVPFRPTTPAFLLTLVLFCSIQKKNQGRANKWWVQGFFWQSSHVQLGWTQKSLFLSHHAKNICFNKKWLTHKNKQMFWKF